MKCLQCGYFNLPQALTCGRCGMDLMRPAPSPGGTLQESLYPPRARERSLKTQARLRLRAPETPPVRLAKIGTVFHPWLVMTVALIPGAGHLLIGDRRQAALLAGAAFLTLALALAWLRTGVSDLLLWGVLGIACFSVWGASDRVFPPSGPDQEDKYLRGLRLAFLSLATVAGTVTSLYWFAGLWYPRYEITDDWTSAVLQPGDDVLTRTLSGSRPGLRRGDVVVASSGQAPVIDRVIGLTGDHVDCEGGTLSVNGQPAGTMGSPLDRRWMQASFHAVVPPGRVCLWLSPAGRFDGEEGDGGYQAARPQGGFGMVAASDVEARVLAVLEPPAHRQWLGRSR